VGSRSGFVCRVWHSTSLVSTMNLEPSMVMLLTGILYDRARCFELLERNLTEVREQENVPVLVAHCEGRYYVKFTMFQHCEYNEALKRRLGQGKSQVGLECLSLRERAMLPFWETTLWRKREQRRRTARPSNVSASLGNIWKSTWLLSVLASIRISEST